MAASIVTISKIGVSGSNIQIKVNDGHPIPSTILTDDIQTFRTWQQEKGHIFIWTDINGFEKSMLVPDISIGWVMSSLVAPVDGDRFSINSPCSVNIALEVLPI